MSVYDLWVTIIRQKHLAFPIKEPKELIYEAISPNFMTHSHLMLIVHFHIFTKIPSNVYFHLQSGINRWELSRFTRTQMSQFASHFTGLRTVMCVLAIITIFERRHVPSAIYALIQYSFSIFAHHNFMLLQHQRSQFWIVLKNNLQIFNKILVSLIQPRSVSQYSSFHQSPDQIFVLQLRQLCYFLPQRSQTILFERLLKMFLHNYCDSDCQVVYYVKLPMDAKPFGSKLIDTHVSYKEMLTSNNASFNQKMKKILTRNYDHIQQLGLFELSQKLIPNAFHFHAPRYDSNLRDDTQEFIVKCVDHFINNHECSYAVVYEHSSIFNFLAFRKFLEKWPQHFFYKLRKVYIVGPSFMVRIVQTLSYGTFYRLCDELFINIDNENALKQADVEVRKAIGEGNIAQTKLKQSVKIIENDLYGKNIDQYDLSFGRYPKIVLQLLTRLVSRPSELRIEGIFRKNCDSEELQRLQGQIIANHLNAIGKEQDIYVVVGCLKKLFNNLRNPLFNYGIYNKIINFQGGDETQLIKSIIGDMEYVNNKVFILMAVFLHDYIISQEAYNKMSAYNIAVIFGPCFFRPKEYDLKDLVYSGKFAKVLVTIFGDPENIIEKAEIDLARGTLHQLNQNQS